MVMRPGKWHGHQRARNAIGRYWNALNFHYPKKKTSLIDTFRGDCRSIWRNHSLSQDYFYLTTEHDVVV